MFRFLKQNQIFWEHCPGSLIVGLIAAYISGNPTHIPIAMIFGWLIDVDHLFDYMLFLRQSSSKFSVAKFFTGSYFKKSGRVILPFHSFEICIGLVSLGLMIDHPSYHWLITASAATALHLAHDQFSHKPNPLGYFFLARHRNDFNIEWFCKI